MSKMRVYCAAFAALALSSCATTSNDMPSQPRNACSMLRENNWGKPLGKASRKWDTRPGLILAIIYQESGFRAKAKPARKGGFLFLPGKRPSDAYGYAQAKDDTWEHYQKSSGERSADRDDFADAADFVGWYVTQTAKRTGVSRNDAVRQYLAYHEGAGGYLRGTYRKKAWLTKTAEKVGHNASQYDQQIKHCSGELKGGGLFGLF